MQPLPEAKLAADGLSQPNGEKMPVKFLRWLSFKTRRVRTRLLEYSKKENPVAPGNMTRVFPAHFVALCLSSIPDGSSQAYRSGSSPTDVVLKRPSGCVVLWVEHFQNLQVVLVIVIHLKSHDPVFGPIRPFHPGHWTEYEVKNQKHGPERMLFHFRQTLSNRLRISHVRLKAGLLQSLVSMTRAYVCHTFFPSVVLHKTCQEAHCFAREHVQTQGQHLHMHCCTLTTLSPEICHKSQTLETWQSSVLCLLLKRSYVFHNVFTPDKLRHDVKRLLGKLTCVLHHETA